VDQFARDEVDASFVETSARGCLGARLGAIACEEMMC